MQNSRILASAFAFALCGLIRLYRLIFGPLKAVFGFHGCCRFTPSCSQYCEEAIREHGPLCGCALGLRRLLRCHPWGRFGPDPIPRKLSCTPSLSL